MTGPPRLQDAIQTVGQALGLGEAEASIYVHLCVTGPAKAGDLAAALKLHRNEVYRTASRLVTRGVVELTLEKPSRYAAVEPQAVFAAEIAARAASLDELRHARDRVSPLLTQMPVLAGAPAKSTYKVVQGRAEIFALRDRLVGAAHATIDWATTFAPGAPSADLASGLDALRARVASDGVKLRAIVGAHEASRKRLAPFAALAGAQLRDIDIDRTVRFLIVDGHDLLMWVVNDPSESMHAKEEVAIHTTAPGFIQAESIFFEQTWTRAKPFRAI